MTSVMWFRKDLRLSDNKALAKACEESEELILFFQLNPEQFIEGSPNHQAFFFKCSVSKKTNRSTSPLACSFWKS